MPPLHPQNFGQLGPKRVLVLQASQTGQTRHAAECFLTSFAKDKDVETETIDIDMVTQHPLPWAFFKFFQTMPDCIHEANFTEAKPASKSSSKSEITRADLIIICTPVWFLSPPPAISRAVKEFAANGILDDTDIIVAITSRNMWVQAYRKIRSGLEHHGARIVGLVVKADPTPPVLSFITTPLWMLTGHKGPYLGGLIPKAGLRSNQLEILRQHGSTALTHFGSDTLPDLQHALDRQQAVDLNEGLLFAESIGHKLFEFFGPWLKKQAARPLLIRIPATLLFVISLILVILITVPISLISSGLWRLFAPRKHAARSEAATKPSTPKNKVPDKPAGET